MRSELVCNKNCSTLCLGYDLIAELRSNPGSDLAVKPHGTLNLTKSLVSTPNSNIIASLADLFEAYFGAVYIENGFDHTKSFLWKLFTPLAREAYAVVRKKRGLKTYGASNALSNPTWQQTSASIVPYPHALEIGETGPSQSRPRVVEKPSDTPTHELRVFCARGKLSLKYKDTEARQQ